MYDEREDEFNEEIIQEETEEFTDSEESVESDETTGETSENEEEGEELPFAKAEVVRLMKQNLDKDKMIRERVKVEMNKFLGEVLVKVCEQLNEYPYTTIEYEMLKESIYPYQNIERINEEKKRILMHLHAIKADCDALSMDVKRTLKLKDVQEEEEDPAFMD
ncbi:hypothetical protein [Methanobacterium formicicum]|jgi:histone H3/H4|uniref:Uncharacterized protein n=1 Tax=Methanobacterium formicicum TaxID=2162 RepID=A0A089ZGR6_METFO|nr:hypothetical protein [Methanobacterium formicicum]AIS31378.1 hypothetical protein BRM9_0555 [Methanobacterium formicicum]CEL25228.1 hypothetical protein MB9_1593 [Methanobacterium formicicum]